VESLSAEMGAMGRQYVPERVPDTTLWDLLSGQRPRRRKEVSPTSGPSEIVKRPLQADDFRRQLRRQVRAMWRNKCLQPQHLPCGVVSVDGKGLGALEHDAEGTAQKGHRNDGSPYWLTRVLRAALVSAPSAPLLDQLPIGAKTNEMGMFIDLFDALQQAYDPLFEIVTIDAGMTSKANADHVHAANKGYVMALKDNQPELAAEAKRLSRSLLRQPPCAESSERYRGKTVHRRLYRSAEIAGYHGWEHLRQVWLVEQDTVDDNGDHQKEQRFFLTNLHVGRLSSAQILTLIRLHWRIEDDCFWSLDMQWHEDALPWCSVGPAVEILGLMRIMAYNLVQLARTRSLRPRGPNGQNLPLPSWRSLFRWVQQALRLDRQAPRMPLPA
jgi:Transposase DDE domain